MNLFLQVEGGLIILKRELGYTTWSDMARLLVQTQKLQKHLKLNFTEWNYLSQQVFVMKRVFFWKKMPKKNHITKEETALPGHKPMKDRCVTLLFCSNASGDLKLKPMLVYHSENPRAFKSYTVMKSALPMMWWSNPKAWVTRAFFMDGYIKYLHQVFWNICGITIYQKRSYYHGQCPCPFPGTYWWLGWWFKFSLKWSFCHQIQLHYFNLWTSRRLQVLRSFILKNYFQDVSKLQMIPT